MENNMLLSSHKDYLTLVVGVLGLGMMGFTYKLTPLVDFQLSQQIVTMGLKLDHLAVIMVMLVTTLGSIVLCYSARYLLSDTTRTRFMYQMISTIISVILFILASNLLSAFIAWQWIGFNLYLLLNHYHYQSEANRSAKKKFIINRIGDTCFLLAIVLCYHVYGTSEYQDLAMTTSKQLTFLNLSINSHTLILGLVFVAIMTKSAQFPFYFWLPDTMQTPTPVSALMHAGVINAGGVLLARLSGSFTQTSWLPYVILCVGIISMIAGSFLKSAQSDIKKKLAYSTMGQMGYMLIQCGLGCFAAAVFHLIAHGFYKAALFLNAGNDLFISSKNTSTEETNSFRNIVKASLLTLMIIGFANFIINQRQITLLLMTFIGISIHQMTLTTLQSAKAKVRFLVLLVIQSILIAYFYLVGAFENWVELPKLDLINKNVEYALSIITVFAYLLTLFSATVKSQIAKFLDMCRIKITEILLIEKFFRKNILDPIRFLGDVLNEHLFNKPFQKWLSIAILLAVPVSAIVENILNQGLLTLFNYFLMAEIIICLLMANRAKNISDSIILLGLSHLCLLVLSFSYIKTLHLGIIISYTAIFAGLFWLIKKAEGQNSIKQAEIENRLTYWGFYLAISLFLLIGVPGTASFVFWFNLMSHVTTNPVITISLMFTNIMSAIVVLHILQDYVFNLSASLELKDNQKWLAKIIYTTIVLSNLYFGIFQQSI